MSHPPGASDAPASTDAAPPRAGWRRWVVLGVVVAALFFGARLLGDPLPRVFAWVDGLGAWGPIAYVGVYVVATVLLFPGALVTLAGGALFGLVAGTAYVFVGAVLGSGAAFLIGRYLARHAVEDRIARDPRFAAIDRAVGRDGLKMVFLLRLSPVFPFSLLNYGLGLTAVRFRDYMLASIGMLPGTLLYVYYGKVAGDLAQLASGVPQERGAAEWAALLVGLLATVAVTVVVTRIARRALTEIDEGVAGPAPDAADDEATEATNARG